MMEYKTAVQMNNMVNLKYFIIFLSTTNDYIYIHNIFKLQRMYLSYHLLAY